MIPTVGLRPITLLERGAQRNAYAEAYIASVGKHVADRELAVIARRLGWSPEQLHVRGIPGEMGPGNALTLTLEFEHLTEVITGFGALGRSAESVAEHAAREARGGRVLNNRIGIPPRGEPPFPPVGCGR